MLLTAKEAGELADTVDERSLGPTFHNILEHIKRHAEAGDRTCKIALWSELHQDKLIPRLRELGYGLTLGSHQPEGRSCYYEVSW